MKQDVTLITCDDCGVQSTAMHEIALTVDGQAFTFDACSQGCAVRLVHGAVSEVTERLSTIGPAMRREA